VISDALFALGSHWRRKEPAALVIDVVEQGLEVSRASQP